LPQCFFQIANVRHFASDLFLTGKKMAQDLAAGFDMSRIGVLSHEKNALWRSAEGCRRL
jgi:hypothetical protein